MLMFCFGVTPHFSLASFHAKWSIQATIALVIMHPMGCGFRRYGQEMQYAYVSALGSEQPFAARSISDRCADKADIIFFLLNGRYGN